MPLSRKRFYLTLPQRETPRPGGLRVVAVNDNVVLAIDVDLVKDRPVPAKETF
jgi:hypothetical protein